MVLPAAIFFIPWLFLSSSAQTLRYENELRLLEVDFLSTHYFKTQPIEGGFVTISYSVASPQLGDFIALYINSSSLTAKTLPLKWAYIDDPAYLASGIGSKRFQLANFRSLGGYVFGLLTGSTRDKFGSLSIYNASLVALTSTPVVIGGDILGPQKPRITLGSPSGPTTLRVTWTSGRDASSTPRLVWGLTKGGPYPYTGREVTTTHLTNSSYCGAPATGVGFSDLGFVHSTLVVLGDAGPLPTPPSSFFYVLRDSTTTTGEEFRASVPPPPGPRYPSTLLAFDDLGRGSLDDAKTYGEYGTPAVNTSSSITALLGANPDGYMGAWLTGDLSYATGTLAVWDWFVFMISPWASSLSLYVGNGNHESGSKWLPGSTTAASPATHNSLFDTNDSGGECSVATLHLFPMPPPATLDAPYWAAPLGPMHLITLSTEHNFTTGSPQWLWLEGVLSGINRTLTPWVLLGAHRPMYVDSNYIQDTPSQRGAGPSTADIPVMAQMQEHLEPLTMKYKVSLALYGHNHVVQRLTPAYRNASVQNSVPAWRPQSGGDTPPTPTRLFARPTATLHMVIGTGGAGFTRNCAAEVGLDPPSWSERCFYQWGYLVVRAMSDTLLQLDWVDGSTGEVEERIDLLQDLAQAWADEGGGGGGAAGAASTGLTTPVEIGLGVGIGVVVVLVGGVWGGYWMAKRRKDVCQDYGKVGDEEMEVFKGSSSSSSSSSKVVRQASSPRSPEGGKDRGESNNPLIERA